MEVGQMTAEQLAAHFTELNSSAGQENNQSQEQQTQNQTVDENQQQTSQEEHANEDQNQVSEEADPFFSQFGENLFKDDLLSPFENEDGSQYIPKSFDDLAELIKANKAEWVQEATQAAIEKDQEALLSKIFGQSTPAFQFIASNANAFNSPEELIPLIQSVGAQDEMANLDLSTEAGQEEVIRISNRLQGLDEASIDDEIQDLKERGKLSNRAERLKPSLEKFYADRTEIILQQQAEKNREQQSFWNNYINTFNKDFYQAADVDGMIISNEHKVMIANTLIPDNSNGGLPIYNIIDDLVGKGDIKRLAKAAFLLLDEQGFENSYGAKKAEVISKKLQKTLKSSVVSNSTDTRSQSNNQTQREVGYGTFL